MNFEKQTIIRAGAVLAILGGFINIVSDQLLYHGPVSGSELNLLYMANNIPYPQTLVGAISGALLGIPLWLGILIPLYYALKPAGRWFSVPAVLLFAHLIVLCAIFHSAAAFASTAYCAFANTVSESESIVSGIMDKYLSFERALMIPTLISMALSSIWIIAAVLARPTLFKRWMVLFTPVFAMTASVLIVNRLPAPIGGYIAPMDGSLFFTAFFVLTAKVTWNYKETEQRKKNGR